MGKIAMSWFISPVMGGFIAAGFLYFIKKKLYFCQDRVSASRKFIPILISIMAWTFSTYLLIKGTKKLFVLELWQAALLGLGIALVIYYFVKPIIFRATEGIEPRKSDVNELFTIPLIISSAILSFAHGANDVANAVGPSCCH
jgi:Phosphate/sulphate permeases